MHLEQAPSLRRAYLAWIEEQVETFKESVPRRDLLSIAEQAINDVSISQSGQLELTELGLCDLVDRKIIKMLKLPSYKTWSNNQFRAADAARRNNADLDPTVALPRDAAHESSEGSRAAECVELTHEVTTSGYKREPERGVRGSLTLVTAAG